MNSQIAFVNLSDPVEKISKVLADGKTPIVTRAATNEIVSIITKIDLINFLGSQH